MSFKSFAYLISQTSAVCTRFESVLEASGCACAVAHRYFKRSKATLYTWCFHKLMGYSRLLSALRIWHYHQDVICILINSIVLHNSNKNTHSYFLTMSNLNVNRIEFSIAGLSFGNIPQSLWLMSPELTTPGQDTIFFDFAAKRFYSTDRTIGIWPFSHRFLLLTKLWLRCQSLNHDFIN